MTHTHTPLDKKFFNEKFHTFTLHTQVWFTGWLGFNGTFSTGKHKRFI